MKYSSSRDRLTRASNLRNLSKFRFLHFVRSNSCFNLCARSQAAKTLFFTQPYASRLHNYCSVTYRSHAILREFKLSRLAFKRAAGRRVLFGVKRSSW